MDGIAREAALELSPRDHDVMGTEARRRHEEAMQHGGLRHASEEYGPVLQARGRHS
jgi:hypothetical protein